MGTTINPLFNGGPEDDESPLFPAITGRGMGFEEGIRLMEANRRKKSPKQIIKEAEGVLNPTHSRPKKKSMGVKPKNLRASDSKKRKAGPFGESYKPPSGAKGKGIRVAESNRGQRMYEHLVNKFIRMGKSKNVAESRARRHMEAMEKTPPGGEDVVRALKKKKNIEEPYAVAWSMKKKGYI